MVIFITAAHYLSHGTTLTEHRMPFRYSRISQHHGAPVRSQVYEGGRLRSESRCNREWHTMKIFVATLCFAIASSVTADPHAAASRITILRGDDVRLHLDVEVAREPAARERGLMGRDSLDARTGMWFDFVQTRPVKMWMKNTRIPLDMIFCSESGEILYIEHGTEPQSLRPVGPPEPLRYVLEINGGEARELELSVGDRVLPPGE